MRGTTPPDLTAPRAWTFEEASREVLEYLQRELPLGLWAVTRRDDDDQVFLDLRGDTFGLVPDQVMPWQGSICRQMAAGGPAVAPRVLDVEGYRDTVAVTDIGVRAYLGAPIHTGDGQVFGTLCGYHDDEVDAEHAEHLAPLLRLLAALLGQILAAETLRRSAAVREAELERLATQDSLTGLATRRVLEDRLEHALDLHRNDGRPVSLLLIDVDDFKTVNDTLGHAAGDELLRQLALGWRARVRDGDTLARLGGDEFALLVETGVPPETVAAVVGDLVTTRLDLDGRPLTSSVSVGLAHVAADAVTPTPAGLLERADVAMYTAKRAGGAGLVVHRGGGTGPVRRSTALPSPRSAHADDAPVAAAR